MKKQTKFQKLAELYRQMPNGGARLTLTQPWGGHSYAVSDGMTIKGHFLTYSQAVHALTIAGFREIEPGVFKL